MSKFIEIYNRLESWRNVRHLDIASQDKNLLGNVLEECTEYIRANSEVEQIDAICDIVVFTSNSMTRGDFLLYKGTDIENSFLNAKEQGTFTVFADKEFIYHIVSSTTRNKKLDILFYCHKQCFSLGYDFVACMMETIQEIDSRVGAWDDSVGKFVKDKSPEAQAKWYKANYAKCKK